MNKEELIAKFDPANAANLNDADLEQMRALTDDELGVLAKAYPNQPQRKAYLILYDKNVDIKKQLYNLSTWQNIYNVRKYANRKNLIPYTFKSLFDALRNPGTSRPAQRSTAPVKKVTVDLTAEDAAKELNAALTKRPVTTSAAKPMATAAVTSQPATTSGNKGDKKASAAKPAKPAAPKVAAKPKAAATPAAEKTNQPDEDFTSGTDNKE